MGTPAFLLCVVLACQCHGSPMPVFDTIVVGLGASGTAAASTLAKAGKKVLALEAQGRIGGRVNTVPFGDGLVELGAEWIHGTEGSPVYELGVTNNVTLLPQDLTFEIYFSDGISDKKDIINELTEFALSAVEEPPETPEPLGQYLSRRVRDHIKTNYPAISNDTEFINAYLDFLDLYIDNYESSNSWNDVTTQSKYTELGGHQHMSWNKHGYKTLFEILLNTYNTGPGYPTLEIKLDTEVTSIQWPRDPTDNVLVSTKDGATYTARNVIVTLSIGVLKERFATLFSPPLPREKVSAIEVLKMGLLDKVILYFDQPWWTQGAFYHWWWSENDKKAVSDEDKWITKISMASSPMGTKHAFTIWFSGDRAKLPRCLIGAVRLVGIPILSVNFVKHTSLFKPPLPAQKSLIIDAIAIGVVDKIVLQFNEAFWPKNSSFFGFMWKDIDKEKVLPSDWWTTKIFGASCPLGNRKALTIWTSGDGAKLVETLPDDVVRSKVMGVVRKFMGVGRTIPEPVGMLRSSWYSNPFTRGSYTYDNVQTPQQPNARADLGAPLTDSAGQPRVLFAGEATELIHFSTVHGAVESGFREAKRLLPASKM